MSIVPLFGPVGPEMLIILLVLVLLFGANKIPKLARSTGEAMGEFKKGREEIEEELEQATQGTTTQSQTGSSSSKTESDTNNTEAVEEVAEEPAADGGVRIPEHPDNLD